MEASGSEACLAVFPASPTSPPPSLKLWWSRRLRRTLPTILSGHADCPILGYEVSDYMPQKHSSLPSTNHMACHSKLPARKRRMVGRAGFEPAYSMRADLQSAAFNHSAIYPLPFARGRDVCFRYGVLTSKKREKNEFLISPTPQPEKSTPLRHPHSAPRRSISLPARAKRRRFLWSLS